MEVFAFQKYNFNLRIHSMRELRARENTKEAIPMRLVRELLVKSNTQRWETKSVEALGKVEK